MERINKDRAESGKIAVRAYMERMGFEIEYWREEPALDGDEKSAIPDLIADILHYAARCGLDTDDMLHMGRLHFTEEVADEGDALRYLTQDGN